MKKDNIKIICTVAGILFFLFYLLGAQPFDAISYSATITVVICVCYDRFLWKWKYNFFVDKPKIYGVYDALFISNYQGRTLHPSVITITQTFSTITIHEKAHDGYSNAVIAELIHDGPASNPWHLYYIYNTRPDPNDHNDPHSGTAILCIDGSEKIEGSYYTNRLMQTKGKLVMVRRSDPNVECPIDTKQYEQ